MSKPREDDILEGEIEQAAAPARPSAVVVHTEQPGANPFDTDPAKFAMQVQRRGDNYQHLVSWLASHMVIGEDLVQVHFVAKSKCRDGGPPNCTPSACPSHWGDPDLSKRGAEKICGLLGLGSRFLGMEDFRAASLKGVEIKQVIIDCEIYNSSREAISQGTGACSVAETYGDLNKAMKTAAKRAHVDAVKRCAGLSGLATEIKRLMTPLDPEAARRKAEAANRNPPPGGGGRWNTGATLTHVPFGKNKGKVWRDCETRALEWYVTNWVDKPDLVRAAAGELSKRRSTAEGSTRNQPPPGIPDDFEDDIPY